MVGMLSDIGNFRERNEDSVGFYKDEDKDIYIVADGMGGHNAGDVASKLAVDKTIEYINNMNKTNDLRLVLEEAIQFANKAIYDLSNGNNDLNGMGTTITACIIKADEIIVANVGDSSCYIIKEDGMFKVTKDHSLVQELVDTGSITEEEALSHPNKNIITRALGTDNSVDVDIFTLNKKEIKKVVLCTDGLSNMVSVNEMYDIITKNSNEDACRNLIELSKQKGGRDNISVIVFEGECEHDRNFVR